MSEVGYSKSKALRRAVTHFVIVRTGLVTLLSSPREGLAHHETTDTCRQLCCPLLRAQHAGRSGLCGDKRWLKNSCLNAS